MRFSPFVPPRRPLFGRRQDRPVDDPAVPRPDPEDRRLIDRLVRHAARRERE